MWETEIEEYWNKFKNYSIKVYEPNKAPYIIGFEELYQKMADKNNEQARKYNLTWGGKDTAHSIFLDFIERIMIKIMDEKYVLEYMIMRLQTYYLYHYYECPQGQDPYFEYYNENNQRLGTIPSNMWRWWVDEMGY